MTTDIDQPDMPRRCRYLTQDYCRDPMAGIDGCCLLCLAAKVNKARTQGGRMAAFYMKAQKQKKAVPK